MLTGAAIVLIVEILALAFVCVRYHVRLTYSRPGWFAEEEDDAEPLWQPLRDTSHLPRTGGHDG